MDYAAGELCKGRLELVGWVLREAEVVWETHVVCGPWELDLWPLVVELGAAIINTRLAMGVLCQRAGDGGGSHGWVGCVRRPLHGTRQGAAIPGRCCLTVTQRSQFWMLS